MVKGGIVNLEFFSMVDVSDVSEILEGDQESAEKICAAARKIDLESNNEGAAEDEGNDQSKGAEESAGTEVEKESEGELESV